MNRRQFVSTVCSGAALASAGCLVGDDAGPAFEIDAVRSYQPNEHALFVVPTVTKLVDDSARLNLTVRVVFENALNHGDEISVIVREDVEQRDFAVPFLYESAVLADKTYRTRVKTWGDNRAAGGWQYGTPSDDAPAAVERNEPWGPGTVES